MVPKPSVSPIPRRNPTVLSMEGSSSSALEVFLVTTGLRNVIPAIPSSLQQQQLPAATVTTMSATHMREILVYAPIVLGFGVLLISFGFFVSVYLFILPILEYADKSPNKEQFFALGNEIITKLNESYEKKERRSLDQGYRVLSENKQDLKFVRICVERLVKWEALICDLVYLIGDYAQENDVQLKCLQSTAMQELVVRELIPILQQDYPEKWREFEQEFSCEAFQSMVFVSYLDTLEGEDPSIVKSICSKSSYDDFVDCALQSKPLSLQNRP